jgi:integrase/recombinase XerD
MSNHNLYQRNGVWWFCVVVAGRKIRQSLRVSDVKSARRLRDQKLEQIESARAGIAAPAWKDAVAAYLTHVTGQLGAKTIQRYAVSIKQCAPWLESLKLTEIKKKTLTDMIEARRRTGVEVATIRRDLTAISVVLTYAEAHLEHEGNPALDLQRLYKERRDPIVLPTREAIDKVHGAATRRFGALIRAAELTGCRLDELVSAKWRNFDKRAGTLLVVGKGNKARTLDLSPAALTHFRTHPQTLDSELIFCTSEGEAYANASSNFGQLCRRVEEIDPKFERFRFHDLRHFYAVHSLLGGMDLWTLQQQLGHTSVKVTESFYLRFLTAEQQAAARRPSTQNRTHLQRFGEGLDGSKSVVSR